jgi:chromatin modification-related protein EAF6
MSVSSVVRDLADQKHKIDQELAEMEAHIYELETSYLTNSQSFGNIVKGYEQLMSQKGTQLSAAPARKPGSKGFKDSERVFTLSSVTSKLQMKAEEEEEGKVAGKYSSAIKRKSKGSKADLLKKRCKGKKEEDSDFSEGTRN